MRQKEIKCENNVQWPYNLHNSIVDTLQYSDICLDIFNNKYVLTYLHGGIQAFIKNYQDFKVIKFTPNLLHFITLKGKKICSQEFLSLFYGKASPFWTNIYLFLYYILCTNFIFILLLNLDLTLKTSKGKGVHLTSLIVRYKITLSISIITQKVLSPYHADMRLCISNMVFRVNFWR